jgi:hypothetical protein
MTHECSTNPIKLAGSVLRFRYIRFTNTICLPSRKLPGDIVCEQKICMPLRSPGKSADSRCQVDRGLQQAQVELSSHAWPRLQRSHADVRSWWGVRWAPIQQDAIWFLSPSGRDSGRAWRNAGGPCRRTSAHASVTTYTLRPKIFAPLDFFRLHLIIRLI